MRHLPVVLGLICAAMPAAARAFEVLSDRDSFVALIEGRELRLALFDVTLQVRPDGTIAGDASGWPVTGRWDWQDGYFCREMDWSGTAIPYNCQLVEARGEQSLRFTVDRGAGASAVFALR